MQSFEHRVLFDGISNVWEVLPKIEPYILSLFEQNAFKANYNNSKNIFIGKGTLISKGALILGPAIIGENCFIGHASLIRENCLVGDNVHIGHGVEVKSSLFLNSSTSAHLNYVGNSIIGNLVNISGGAMIANYRLDKKPVTIKLSAGDVSTNLEKFGAVIGDGAIIGVNSVLNPGTLLGRNTVVYPLKSVVGFYKNGEKIA